MPTLPRCRECGHRYLDDEDFHEHGSGFCFDCFEINRTRRRARIAPDASRKAKAEETRA